MPNNYMSLTFETDMSRGISPVTIKAAIVYDDNLAHNVRIKCMEKGRFQSMSGTVQAYFIRADNSTVPMNGQIVDGVPEVKLLPECYNIAGRFLFLVKITNSGSTNTIFYGTGNVLRGRTDVVIDPGEVVPSLDELLAKINELELATNASFEATERANSAAETANTAAAAADEVRQDIQSGLAGKAPAIFVTASGDLVHITDGAAMPVKSLITHIEPVQSGSGTPSPENVRPISGWAGAVLNRTGKNLVNVADKSGTVSYYADVPLNYKVKLGQVLTLSVDVETSIEPFNVSLGIGTASAYKKDISSKGTQYNGRVSVTVTITAEHLASGEYLFFRCPRYGTSDPATYTVKNIQLVLNTGDTSYEEPKVVQCNAQFGQTVYGGELDWKTGVLTKRKHGIVFTGNETFVRRAWDDYSGEPVLATNQLEYRADYNYRQPTRVITKNTHFADVGTTNLIQSTEGVTIYGESTWTQMFFRIPRSVYGATASNTDEELITLWKNWLAAQYAAGTPFTVVYDLYTPEEIQLTPQQILSIEGENNIWSDTGETEVTYAADTKMYIDQKIAAIAAAVLNN